MYRLGLGHIVFALTYGLSLGAQAQILNIEKRRLDRAEEQYLVGNVGVHFNYNNRSPTLQSPARVMNTGISSHLAYFTDDHAYILINEYQMHLINESEIVNTGFSHARIQFHRERTFGYEFFTQYQYDRPRGLSFRWLGGAGPRLRLLQSKRVNLTMGVGAMVEFETWQDPFDDGRSVGARFLKSNSYVSTRVELSEHVDFNSILYHQAGYDRTHARFRHRISADINLSVKLSQYFSLTSSFSGSYETAPVVEIIPFVFATTNGIRLDF